MAGESIALVSDAGTPLISDPGQGLVAAARGAGVPVEAVPGPSAVMAALSIAGLPIERFTFGGFPPNRSKDRIAWLSELLSSGSLLVIFEAPHRILGTLSDLQGIVGPTHVVAVGRELTKQHEELVVKPINAFLADGVTEKGEFTVIIPVSPSAVGSLAVRNPELSEPELVRIFGQMIENEGLNTRQALRQLSRISGRPVNELYQRLKTPDK